MGRTQDILELPDILLERLQHYFLTYKLQPAKNNQVVIHSVYSAGSRKESDRSEYGRLQEFVRQHGIQGDKMKFFDAVSPFDARYYGADETFYNKIHDYLSEEASIRYFLQVEAALVETLVRLRLLQQRNCR